MLDSYIITHVSNHPFASESQSKTVREIVKMASTSINEVEVEVDLSPLIKVYKDGTVERLVNPQLVPPSPETPDPTTGIFSKDINISSQISARLYFPKLKSDESNNQKLPIIVYYHCGGFCVESAFSFRSHRYLNLLVSETRAIAVSVEYRLAPEHPLPTASEDSWAALQWVASHVIVDDNSTSDHYKDPWLINHGDFGKLYVGGDSAGGNIAHNITMRAGTEKLNGDVKIKGAFLSFPAFWGSKSKAESEERQIMKGRVWKLVYPSAPGGIDNPLLNPLADDAPDLSKLGCSKLFVCVAEKDDPRDTTLLYVEALRKSGWKGEVEVADIEDEGHCFPILRPDSEKANNLIKHIASFIN